MTYVLFVYWKMGRKTKMYNTINAPKICKTLAYFYEIVYVLYIYYKSEHARLVIRGPVTETFQLGTLNYYGRKFLKF